MMLGAVAAKEYATVDAAESVVVGVDSGTAIWAPWENARVEAFQLLGHYAVIVEAVGCCGLAFIDRQQLRVLGHDGGLQKKGPKPHNGLGSCIPFPLPLGGKGLNLAKQAVDFA